jgi:beta-galactosidase
LTPLRSPAALEALLHPAGRPSWEAPAIGLTASQFRASDLYAARHTCDLEPRSEVILSLDHAQRGLGTASCGPDVRAPYRLNASSYRFSYVLGV